MLADRWMLYLGLCTLAFLALAFLLFRARMAPLGPTVVRQRTPQASLQQLRRIFVYAFALRAGLAVIIPLLGLTDYFGPDRLTYEIAGRAIVESWRGTSYLRDVAESLTQESFGAYHHYNAIAYYFFGAGAPLAVRLVNSLVGASCVFLSYGIAAPLGGTGVGVRAAQFVAFFPSLVLWSSLNLRDAWAVLAVLGAVYGSFCMRDGQAMNGVLILLGSLLLLGAVRGYMFLVVAGAIALGHVLTLPGRGIQSYIGLAVAALAFVYLYHWLGLGQSLVERASFDTLNTHRSALAQGGSAYYDQVDISTPGKALRFLPLGVAMFLFAPYPWLVRSGLQALTLPEVFAWYYLAIRYFLPGARLGIRHRRQHAVILLAVVALVTGTYGLVEGNMGTAYRHRAQILPLLLAVCALGQKGLQATAFAQAEADKQRPAPQLAPVAAAGGRRRLAR